MENKRKVSKYSKEWGEKIKKDGGYYRWGRWWTGGEDVEERREAKVRYIKKRYRHFRKPFFKTKKWLTAEHKQ